MSDSQPKRTGERFGRYVLLEQIGHGGMAEVFRAVAHGVEGFQRVFVLKRILKDKSASKEFIDMFVSEARISALLNHPNIVQIYDFGQIGGSYFLTMEYLRGKDLLSVMRQLRATGKFMAPGVAAFIAQQVATGLHYAHSLTHVGGKTLSIVHRDVSPSNIMLLRAGGVKLLDFGIAKAATEVKSTGNTQAGLIKGKLSYLSPEQIRALELDGRSDVFSLGVTLWEMLTGRRLFYDKNDFETMKNVLERPVPPPSMQRPDVPTALDYIVIRALERDLARRYTSAKEMADELGAFLEETRFATSSVTKMLDELFGEDTGQFEAQVPEAVDLTPVPLPGADELVGANLSASVPPLDRTGERERGGAREGLGRRKVRLVAAASAVGVLAAAGFALSLRAKPTTAASGTAAVAAPAPVAPRPAPAPEAAPAHVNVRIDSDPAGAEVKTAAGVSLGSTPASASLPRGSESIVLVLQKPGFEEVRHVITPDRDVAALVTLRAVPAPKRVAPAPPPRPTRAPGARRADGAAKAPSAPVLDGKVKEAVSVDPFAEEPGKGDKP